MPIFEYFCHNCTFEFERLVFKRDEEVTCPKCNGHVDKKFSVFSHKTEGGKFVSSKGNACGSCAATSCAGCKAS